MNSPRPHRRSSYLKAVLRRKLILVIPPLVLPIATGFALARLPHCYEASSRLEITNVNASDLGSQLSKIRQDATNQETLKAILDEQNGMPEQVTESLRRGIVVIPDPGSNHFTISYRSPDPETAQTVIDALARKLAENSRDLSAPSPQVEFLRKRVADLQIQVREIEDKDPSLLRARGSTPTPPESRGFKPSQDLLRAQETIESLKDQQYKTRHQLGDLERRVAIQRQVVEQQKKGYRLRDNPTYAVLIAKRTELQGQRDTLVNRQELTDNHPRVLAINDQIAAINRQIEELRQQDASLVGQSPEARELDGLESERNRLRIELEVTGRELARRSAAQSVTSAPPDPTPIPRHPAVTKLIEEYLALKRSYNDARAQLDGAESKLENVSAQTGLRILEPATLPERPVARGEVTAISGAAVLGFALGAIFALIAESRRLNSLRNAGDVEYYARLPLLAEIPRTTTVSERMRARWRAVALLTFAAAFSVAATLALTRILIASDIFARLVIK